MVKTDIFRTYYLEQQTPMIHFQSDEEGAILRASEVKPKLDRFLLDQLGDEKLRGDHPEWFISEEHRALNYKMRITVSPTNDNASPVIEEPGGLFFGNMGKEKKKNSIFYDSKDFKIKVRIICCNPDLMKEIDQHFAAFFLLHNFGTRQSKGFGSFLLQSNDLSDPVDLIKQVVDTFIYVNAKGANTKKKMEYVKTFWNLLKGGINYTSNIINKDGMKKKQWTSTRQAYHKSFIVRKYSEKGIGSEKYAIKAGKILNKREKQLPDDVSRKQIPCSYAKRRFVRALLGLTDTYRFSDFDIDDNVKVVSSKKINDQPAIQRFASPITVKIINDYIIFLPEEIPEQILNQAFIFSSKSGKQISLKTPDKDDLIDLRRLLIDFANDFNANKAGMNDKGHGDLIRISALTMETFGGDGV